MSIILFESNTKMALRLILQGTRVKSSANPIAGLFDTFSKNLCCPSSSSSSSSSLSCSLHNAGSSIPKLTGDVIKTQDVTALCGGTGVYQGAQKDEWIISLAKFAVTKHNENQNAHLQVVRVVGASHTELSSLLYHITLEATDARKQKIFHAVVWLQLWKNLMELLVWKSVHDALSAVGIKRGNPVNFQPFLCYK